MPFELDGTSYAGVSIDHMLTEKTPPMLTEKTPPMFTDDDEIYQVFATQSHVKQILLNNVKIWEAPSKQHYRG